VAHHDRDFTSSLACDVSQCFPGTRSDLGRRFDTWRVVEGTPLSFDGLFRSAGPLAVVTIDEAGVDLHVNVCPGGNGPCRLHRSTERAGHHQPRPSVAERRPQPFGLLASHGIEWRVEMSS
jgi:hypothetical protein